MNQDRRNWHGNEPGILRKKEETESELLVFGYSCKLFRDDEKALIIDQGKHLIPWMGDELLKIDRYDVRGALFDISKYEASNIETNIAWDSLSSDERKVELMCDEERYRALFHNEDEEALYQEEELKRLHQALGSDKEYGQVAYQYEDKQSENVSNLMDEVTSDDQQEPFTPPAQLDIPPNMTIPETKKQNAIIEKTAMFINQQGPQMEILLKMKQASNPQFEFLSISCPLHSYYRHVLAVVKTGRYKPTLSNSDKHYRHNDYDDHYLHPSLLPIPSTLELAPSIPSISYRPSADCAYSMLVNRIKSKQEGNITSSISTTVNPVVEDSKEIFSPPVKYTSNIDTDSVDPDKSASPIVMKMVSKATKRRRRKRHIPSVSPSNGQQSPKSINPKKTGLNNDLDSSAGNLSQPESSIEEPPGELKVIIDKMASYVVKNGRDFEAIVKNKGDPRFFFLNFGSQFHTYYEQKVTYYKALSKPDAAPFPKDLLSPVYSTENNESVSEEEDEVKEMVSCQDSTLSSKSSTSFSSKKSSSLVTNSTFDDEMLNKPNNLLLLKATKLQQLSDSENHSTNKPIPVCFSIKKPKEVDKLELCSALPVEESSDEEEEKEEDCTIKSHTESVDKLSHGKKSKAHTISMDKWAEERVKDKLAQAAKEKLAMKEKEKQLQLERKKRAQAFLNLLQKDNLSPLRKPLVNDLGLKEDSESRPTSVPSSITSLSSDGSADDEDDTHIHSHLRYEAMRDKAHASQTLQRILDAVPKERNSHGKKSHHSTTSHSQSYSKSGSEMSSKHNHHKSHKRHHSSKEKETHHRHSHKRKHKTKKSKSHKRRRKSGSVHSLSSD